MADEDKFHGDLPGMDAERVSEPIIPTGPEAREQLREDMQSDPDLAPADPNAAEKSQSLSELMAEAGLQETVTITEGLDDTPEDHVGRTAAEPRDDGVSHPEEGVAFTGSYRLTDLLTEWFRESVQRWDQGEQIVWEISVMAFPDPNQRGMFHPGLVFAVCTKGAQLGSVIFNTVVEQPFGLSREAVDQMVKMRIGELLEGRSQQLDEMTREAATAQQNGHQPPSGGLIVPGR